MLRCVAVIAGRWVVVEASRGVGTKMLACGAPRAFPGCHFLGQNYTPGQTGNRAGAVPQTSVVCSHNSLHVPPLFVCQTLTLGWCIWYLGWCIWVLEQRLWYLLFAPTIPFMSLPLFFKPLILFLVNGTVYLVFWMIYLVFRLVYLWSGTVCFVFVVSSHNYLHGAQVCLSSPFSALYTVLPEFVFVFVHVNASAPQ